MDSHQTFYGRSLHTAIVAHTVATGIVGLVQTARETDQEYRDFRARIALESGCEIELIVSIARRDARVSVEACASENDRPLDTDILNKVLELLPKYYPGGTAVCDNGFDISLKFTGR
ncbi:MAG TPA: hypothetical protein VLA88_03315 [Candidatus Saccharimonadales bacterium]|nr:hypothetical protein [Candidatus Saccharimonadales bacterium]